MTAVELEGGDTPAIYEHSLKVPVKLIDPNPNNPRRDETPDETLIASITQVGLIEPLIVRPVGDRFQLLAGHRRLAAVKAAGFDRVPCMLRHTDDADALAVMIIENLARKDLSPLEEAAGIEQLTTLGRSQRQVATLIGVSQSHISKRLALLKLPDVAREALDSGGITVEDAVKLSALDAKTLKPCFKGGKVQQHEIRTALWRHEQAQKKASARADLEKRGIPVLDKEPGWGWDESPASLRSIGISDEDHESEPCHAAHITPGAYVQYACTDPSRHPRPTEDEDEDDRQIVGGRPQTWVKGHGWVSDDELTDEHRRLIEEEKQARAKADAERAQQELDSRRRLEWMRGHIEHHPIPQRYPEVFGFVAVMIPCVSDLDMGGVVDLLGLEVPDDFDMWDHGPELVQAYASSGSPHAGLKVTLALALDVGNSMLRYRDPEGFTATAAKTFLAYLREHGYELSDLEREILGEPAQEAANGEPYVEVVPSGKFWKVTCSECGSVASRQTTEEFAEQRRTDHLWEAHGVREEVAS